MSIDTTNFYKSTTPKIQKKTVIHQFKLYFRKYELKVQQHNPIIYIYNYNIQISFI